MLSPLVLAQSFCRQWSTLPWWHTKSAHPKLLLRGWSILSTSGRLWHHPLVGCTPLWFGIYSMKVWPDQRKQRPRFVSSILFLKWTSHRCSTALSTGDPQIAPPVGTCQHLSHLWEPISQNLPLLEHQTSIRKKIWRLVCINTEGILKHQQCGKSSNQSAWLQTKPVQCWVGPTQRPVSTSPVWVYSFLLHWQCTLRYSRPLLLRWPG